MTIKNNSKSPFDKGYEAARKAMEKATEKAANEALQTEDPESYWLGWNAYIQDNSDTLGL